MSRPATIDVGDVFSSQANGTIDLRAMDMKFLGSKALSLFISAIETGMIIVLLARFIVRRRERSAIQLLVYFTTSIALFQLGVTFAAWWRVAVTNFGNWTAITDFQWPDKIHFTLSSFIAAPVQLFYIWRCWHVSLHRRPYIAFLLVLLVIGSIATDIYVLVVMCIVDWKKDGRTSLLALRAYYICSVSLAFSVVTDFFVTAILLNFLIRSRSDMHTRQFRHVLFRLILITWEAAVPPFLCAIGALIDCSLNAPIISNWGIMLQTVLGKLYLVSLLVTLEGRAMLAGATNRTYFPSLTLTGVSQNIGRWSVRPGELDHADAPKPPDCSLQFKVISSDPGAEEGSTFDPETTGTTETTEPQTV